MATELTADPWVAEAKEGDRDAFGKLYDRYFDRIYRYLYYRTLHRETAEDLTSQTFLRALDKLKSFDPAKGTFSPWIFRIAGNLLIDHFRKKGRVETVSAVWDLPDEGDFVVDVHNRLAWENLKPVLDKLPSEKREIVILKIWDDMTFREIAELTGKSEGACKMSFARTLKFLKESVPLPLYLFILMFPKLLQ